MNRKIKVAVLVSGGGTNLQALIDEQNSNKECPYEINLVISSTKDSFSLQRAQNAGIKNYIASPVSVLGKEKYTTANRDEKRLAVSNKVLEIVKENKVDIIVLAGFLTVLSGQILHEYKNKIINLHPALLPKFGGVGMWGHNVHEKVLESGEKESGCTIHLVDEGCDTGKILLQKKVPVLPDDTPDSLYARIAPFEHIAMVEGVKLLSQELQSSVIE